MKTVSKKSTITIITLSCLLAVAVASTIILAAFSAVRTSTTTITFANGLTMTLATAGTTGATLSVTDSNPGTNAGTFTYSAGSDYETAVTLDGIEATLSRDGWVAYQISMAVSTTAASPQAIAGTWSYTSGNTATFTKTLEQGETATWAVTFTFNSTDFTATGNGTSTLTVKSNARWDTNTLTQDLFTSIVIDATGNGTVNDLAGKSFVATFTIKADTTVVEGENPANPITFS